MAISRTPVFKRCDYLGLNPAVLGYTHKPSTRRAKPTRKRKKSDYARQLIEKQKLRFVYGVLEKQFKLIYAKAEKGRGVTGENLLRLLELRFDNIVYRLGLAATRAEGRQKINHRHLLVNGKRMDIPSATLKVGDIISTKDPQAFKLRKFEISRSLPPWLAFNEETFEASVIGEPQRSDIDFEVTESAVVELYSK